MFNPQLATFVCVADCGSFSQAAEKLIPLVHGGDEALNALERHLELKLLERTRRGTVLTPAGEVIYRYARQMFADSDRALREARAAAQAARSAFLCGNLHPQSLPALYGPVVPLLRALPRLPAPPRPL